MSYSLSYPVFTINTEIQLSEFIKTKTYKKRKDTPFVPTKLNIEVPETSEPSETPETNDISIAITESALSDDSDALTYNFITNLLNNNPKLSYIPTENSDSDNEVAKIFPMESPPDHVKLYRSVLTDENNDILCYSPPSATSLEEFKQKNPVITTDIYANEIIEGTMINLFYDKRIKSWELSTRATVGGNYWYYRTQYSGNEDASQLTFRQMFMECMGYNKNEQLMNIEILKEFHTNCCYSFVIQHPLNHMVLNITFPRIYLVSVYKIDKHEISYIPPTIYESWDIFRDSSTSIEFPKECTFSTYDEYQYYYASLHTSHEVLGVMFTNLITGDRAAMSNVVYECIRKLRGNNSNLQYQFFELKHLDEKQKFLKYFPMYTDQFFNFNQEYQQLITSVHQYYYVYYVLKQPQENPIPKKYFIHVSRIHHNIYIPSLTTQRVVITRSAVENYFNSMSAGELMHYMYYQDKPKKVCEIVLGVVSL